MKEYFYLLSGNIDPSRDTDKIHLDMLKSTGKEKPHILLFATASTGTDWHQNYLNNISGIFNNYNCTYKITDSIEEDHTENINQADIIYFLGGSPYKHTQLNKYKEQFRKVPVKAGTSAGAIYLGYNTFYVGKDDYLIAVPGMLDFVDLHVLPHSETHTEEMVSNYLVNEAFISMARLYNQSGLKIENENGNETVTAIMGETSNSSEKVELVMKDRTYFKTEADKVLPLKIKIVK